MSCLRALSTAVCLLLCLVLCPGQALAATGAVSSGAKVLHSPNDERQYLYFTLPNQLPVLLISDPQTDKAAAALDVNVGSGDDPYERGGLAHFLEHMLFLGTEKYPEPGEYQSFIAARGGSHNAYTSDEHTNYFFDVEAPHLEPALDRFAQFFIAPLFTPEYVDRERNAVHSEYTANLKNSYRRERDVLRQIVNPRHPMSKFSVGSLDTLADRDGSPVRDDLLDFYQAHYSADNMALVVLGRESLAQLRELVTAHFSDIPQRPTRSALAGVPLFEEKFLPARVNIQPPREERRLTLMFPIPPAGEYYAQKPLQYLGNLLGHEGEGSLLSLLKELGWAEGLSAGSGSGQRNETTFNISIQLTPEGLQNQDKVVATTFRMIQLLKDNGIEEWRFKEQQTLAEVAFRFAEKGEPIQVVRQLADQMHRYPPADIIRGRYAFDEFDARLIRRYLRYLRPDNVLWVVTAPDVKTEQLSPFYQTPYAVEQMDNETASMPVHQLQQLQLPAANEFLPRRLKVKSLPAMEVLSPVPQLIKHTDRIAVWFRQDDQFRVPRASLHIRVFSPAVPQSAKTAAMSQLYAAVVSDALNEHVYPAALAGLHFSVNANSRGFDLKLSGYDDRQSALLSRILAVMERGRFDRERVERRRQELIREWRNQASQSPYRQLLSELPVLLFEPLWDQRSLATALESVSDREWQSFTASVWDNSRLQVLLYGNLYRQEAIKLAALIEQKLHESSDTEPVRGAQVVQLSDRPRHYHLPVDHSDVAAVLYLQAFGRSVEDRAQMLLLQQMLKAPFFHELRTERQLGYAVFASSYGLKDVMGDLLVVQSPSAGPEELVAEIQAFLVRHLGDADNFAAHQQALLASLSETPKNLPEQAERYWEEILHEYPQFDRRQQLIEAVRALTPEAAVEYGHRLLSEPRLLWLTAGAEPFSVETAEALEDAQSFKREAETYEFP